MLCVILPVFNHIQWTDNCLNSLKQGTKQPSEIILIDNGNEETCRHLVEKYRSLNIHYIGNEENIGVNSSWNLGLSITKRKNVLFLNNDTNANRYFIEKIIRVMKDPTIGICVPTRFRGSNLESKSYSEEDPVIQECIFIEGWAFTMRREIFDKVGFIPMEFKTFMGDTYFFECSKWLKYRNVKMMNNLVYHYGSGTLKDFCNNLQKIALHRSENYTWRKMVESIKNKVLKLN